MNEITLYDENGLPVTFDLSAITDNQSTIIQQNTELQQQNAEIIQKLDEQIKIENTAVQFLGFCFVMLVVSFLYRIFHSVMSF